MRNFGEHVQNLIPDLAAIRRSRAMSIEQIASQTKIRAYYLEAIERGRFEKLPGGVYNTNYIRQYARAIAYSEDELLAFYRKTGSPARQQSGYAVS